MHELAAPSTTTSIARCICQSPPVACAGTWNGSSTLTLCPLEVESDNLGACTCSSGPVSARAPTGMSTLYAGIGVSLLLLLLLVVMLARWRCMQRGWRLLHPSNSHLLSRDIVASSSHTLPLPIQLRSGARALGVRIHGVQIEIPPISLSEASRATNQEAEGHGPSHTERSDRSASERARPGRHSSRLSFSPSSAASSSQPASPRPPSPGVSMSSDTPFRRPDIRQAA